MLIIDNASIPVNNEPDTYTGVIKAWMAALAAMNNLARGMPQVVQDRAALLAISSWHLYPDIVLYGGPVVEVKQKDSMFKISDLLTFGLPHFRDECLLVTSTGLSAALLLSNTHFPVCRFGNCLKIILAICIYSHWCLFVGWGNFPGPIRKVCNGYSDWDTLCNFPRADFFHEYLFTQCG